MLGDLCILWAKHDIATFWPVVIDSHLITVIEDAPMDWGVHLLESRFLRLDSGLWIRSTPLSEGELRSLDSGISLYRMSVYECAVLLVESLSQKLEECDNKVLLIPDYIKDMARTDLSVYLGEFISKGRLDTLFERAALGIDCVTSHSAIDSVSRLLKRAAPLKYNTTTDPRGQYSQIKKDVETAVAALNLDASAITPVLNHIESVNNTVFGVGKTGIKVTRDEGAFLRYELFEDFTVRSKYPRLRKKSEALAQQSKIANIALELFSAKNMGLVAIRYLVDLVRVSSASSSELAIVRDFSNSSKSALHSDSDALIESLAFVDIGSLFTPSLMVEVISDSGLPYQLVALRCTKNVPTEHVETLPDHWIYFVLDSAVRLIDCNLVSLLTEEFRSGRVIDLQSEVAGHDDFCMLRKGLDQIGQACDLKGYRRVTLKTDIPWVESLPMKSKSWVARFLVRSIAANRGKMLLIRRYDGELECRNSAPIVSSHSLIEHDKVDLAYGETIVELNFNHLSFLEMESETCNVEHLAYTDMLERGWRAKKAVLYREVERFLRALPPSEALLEHFEDLEDKLALIELLNAPTNTRFNDLLDQVFSVVERYARRRQYPCLIFSVDAKSINTLAVRLRVDAFLKCLDWPGVLSSSCSTQV